MSEVAVAQRKITQLDNDVSAIYSMLANIEGTQRRHGTRLEEIDSQLAALTSDVKEIKTDVGDLKTDVGDLKSDVGDLKSQLAEVLAILRK